MLRNNALQGGLTEIAVAQKLRPSRNSVRVNFTHVGMARAQ
jgi:hypothetical protein